MASARQLSKVPRTKCGFRQWLIAAPKPTRLGRWRAGRSTEPWPQIPVREPRLLGSPPDRLTALRSGVELQVKRGGPHGLLLVAREAGEAVGESIGDPKFRAISHAPVRPT
jgi:hypothetical protein